MDLFSGISDLFVFNGDLYVTGRFSIIAGTGANGIAKWNGVAWSNLGNGLVDDGIKIYSYNNQIIASETFVALNTQFCRISQFDGSNWTSISPDLSYFQALVVYNNELYAGGYFYGIQNFKSLIKLSVSTNILENNSLEKHLFVFPNPTNTSFLFSFESTSNNFEIFLHNMSGSQVYFSKEETAAGKFSKQINVENLPNGIYFLEVKTKEGVLNKKVVVQHP